MSLSKSVSLVALLSCLAFVAPAQAADPPPPAGAVQPSARALELAHRYVVAQHVDRTMETMMATVMPQAMEQALKASGKQIPPKVRADVAAIVNEVMAETMHDMVAKMMARLPQIYAESFSEQELEDFVAFFESTSGQAMLAKAPAVAGRLMPMITEMMPDMQAKLMSRLCAKYPEACPAPTAGRTPKPT